MQSRDEAAVSAARYSAERQCFGPSGSGVRIEIGGLYLDGDQLVSLQAALPNGYIRVRDEASGEEHTIQPGRLKPRVIDTDQSYAPASVDLPKRTKPTH